MVLGTALHIHCWFVRVSKILLVWEESHCVCTAGDSVQCRVPSVAAGAIIDALATDREGESLHKDDRDHDDKDTWLHPNITWPLYFQICLRRGPTVDTHEGCVVWMIGHRDLAVVKRANATAICNWDVGYVIFSTLEKQGHSYFEVSVWVAVVKRKVVVVRGGDVIQLTFFPSWASVVDAEFALGVWGPSTFFSMKSI